MEKRRETTKSKLWEGPETFLPLFWKHFFLRHTTKKEGAPQPPHHGPHQKISQFEIFHEVRRNFPISFSTNPLAKTKKTWGHLFDEIEAGRRPRGRQYFIAC